MTQVRPHPSNYDGYSVAKESLSNEIKRLSNLATTIFPQWQYPEALQFTSTSYNSRIHFIIPSITVERQVMGGGFPYQNFRCSSCFSLYICYWTSPMCFCNSCFSFGTSWVPIYGYPGRKVVLLNCSTHSASQRSPPSTSFPMHYPLIAKNMRLRAPTKGKNIKYKVAPVKEAGCTMSRPGRFREHKNPKPLLEFADRDSAVGISTLYGPDDSRIESR